jgi:hypothetical protein
MAAPSVTYTFTNGTTIDATQVNTNFTDLISGMSDGTKDFTINALTANGSATFNGAMTFGNASGDDLVFTGSVASTIPIKANTTYDFGSSTLGLLSVYIGGTSSFTTRIKGAATASWTFTLPATAGTNLYVLGNQGSGTTDWVPLRSTGFDAKNLSLSCAVGSSALTVTLKSADGTSFSATNPGVVNFRSATLTTGTPLERTITSDLTVTVSNGSTLGMTTVTDTYLYIYLIDNAGTPELAIMNGMIDDGRVTTSVAEGGAGAADSANVLYSTSGRVSKATRLIGRILAQNTAGAWGSAPTEVTMLPFDAGNLIEGKLAIGNTAITAGNFGDVISISLTPGEWDIYGEATLLSSGATTTTNTFLGISSTTGNSATGLTIGDTMSVNSKSNTNGFYDFQSCSKRAVVVSATTTYYLKGRFDNSITNLQIAAKISARRVR